MPRIKLSKIVPDSTAHIPRSGVSSDTVKGVSYDTVEGKNSVSSDTLEAQKSVSYDTGRTLESVSSDTPSAAKSVSYDTVKGVSSDTQSVSSDTVVCVSYDTDRRKRYKQKLSRIVLDLRTEEAESIRACASSEGLSVAAFIRRCIDEHVQRKTATR